MISPFPFLNASLLLFDWSSIFLISIKSSETSCKYFSDSALSSKSLDIIEILSIMDLYSDDDFNDSAGISFEIFIKRSVKPPIAETTIECGCSSLAIYESKIIFETLTKHAVSARLEPPNLKTFQVSFFVVLISNILYFSRPVNQAMRIIHDYKNDKSI